MRMFPRAVHRPLVVATGVLCALAVGGSAALAADASTTVTANVNTVLAVSAPASLDFGTLSPGDSATSTADVTVVSNVSNGYTLTTSRTVFSNGDIPLAFTGATNPANTTVSPTGAIPTTGSRTIGVMAPGSITAQAGDHWLVNLGLGPVPFVKDGAHTATVTFTATATP